MRVAVDAANLWNDRRGMGRYTRSILANFAKCAELEVVLVVRDQGHVAKLQTEEQLRVVTVATAKREVPFDVVWYPWNGICFRLATAACVTTVHDIFAFTMPHPDCIARWREQKPIRRAFRDSHVLCTVSQWSMSEIQRIAPHLHAPIMLAPPIPNPFWQPHPTPTAVPLQKPYVLTVTGPDVRKNMALAITAMERAFPDQRIRFIVAGCMREEDAQLLRASRCDYEHVQPNDHALRELYQNALMVLVPSRFEGYGLMVIEAMACGTPVIASNASALSEVAAGAALLVGTEDLDGWVAAIHSFANNPHARRRYIALGLARVTEVSQTFPTNKTLEALHTAVALQRTHSARHGYRK